MNTQGLEVCKKGRILDKRIHNKRFQKRISGQIRWNNNRITPYNAIISSINILTLINSRVSSNLRLSPNKTIQYNVSRSYIENYPDSHNRNQFPQKLNHTKLSSSLNKFKLVCSNYTLSPLMLKLNSCNIKRHKKF